MELYKIMAANYNGDFDFYELEFIPENFEGVNVKQVFNWSTPMGYTPTFSINTMRIIDADKAWTDSFFDQYGKQTIIHLEIFKLNEEANDYDSISTFAINFDTYQKMDD